MKISRILSDRKFLWYIHDLITDKTLSLENYIHHKRSTRLRHCLGVAYINYKICSFLRLDSRAAARAGLLHDYFFYNRKDFSKNNKKSGHLLSHPLTALKNASEIFGLSDREADIILSHMWPLSYNKPHFPESAVIILVDKFCAVTEVLRFKKKRSRL